MQQLLEKQKKKDLGQYFTPENVVAFMYDMLKLFLPKRQKHLLKIIDPACGEGVFLKYALENKITKANYLFGCDIDSHVQKKWKELEIYGRLNLLIQDGLLDDEDGLIKRNSFDIVIGNPPYGGMGLAELGRFLETKERKYVIKKQVLSFFDSDNPKLQDNSPPLSGTSLLDTKQKESDLKKLAYALSQYYESWRKAGANNGGEENIQNEKSESDNPFDDNYWKQPHGQGKTEYLLKKLEESSRRFQDFPLSAKELRRLITFPIEILFTERFVQLAKPGGLIAIILPEGIFANEQTQYFRDWLLQKCSVLAIVSLPRKVFAYAGVNAKTCILFMQRDGVKENIESKKKKYVWLSAPEKRYGQNVILEDYFKEVLEALDNKKV